KFYNVKQGSSLTESDYPVVEVTDGYEEPVTWSIPSGTPINEAADIVSTAVKTKIADTTAPNLPDKIIVGNKNKLTSEEKTELKNRILEANKDKFPEGTEIKVGDNGDTIITYPDGSKDTIPGVKLVTEKSVTEKPEKPEKLEKPEKPSQTDSPESEQGSVKTGDTNEVYQWLILMILSASGLLLGVFRKKSSGKRDS
ncbi:MAG TPA: LPXTG cell wall anchor domain-containing protein, partial [Mogibacterium sp.]|nr:LPXTG cell wall anchor domain-containing protein [Mogibacterium sp.]